MQQLAGLFPGSYYNNDESKALDFMGYFAHQRQQDEAFKNQEINRQGALEDLFQTRQLNPLKVDNQRLMNDTLDAQLGGHRARSKEAELKLDTDTQLQPHVIKQKLQEALTGLTESELKGEIGQINKMLLNPYLSPKERKVFEMLRDNMPDVYKLNQTLQTKEDVAGISANRPTGRAASAAKPPAPPKKMEDLQAYYEYQAGQTDDPEEKARFTALARGIFEQRAELERFKAASRKEGGVDVGTMGVPTIPAPTLGGAQPSVAPKPTLAPNKASLVEVQKMYPGIPADKLKEAYKRKFGVELK